MYCRVGPRVARPLITIRNHAALAEGQPGRQHMSFAASTGLFAALTTATGSAPLAAGGSGASFLADLAEVTHVGALIVGFGAMLASDVMLLRRTSGPLRTETLRTYQIAYYLMATAVAMAWVSGVFLVWNGLGGPLAPLFMKFAILVVLTGAVVLTPHAVFPALLRALGHPLEAAEFDDKVRIALASAVSIASWASVLVLGLSAMAVRAPWPLLMMVIVILYGAALTLMLRRAVMMERRRTNAVRPVVRAVAPITRSGHTDMPPRRRGLKGKQKADAELPRWRQVYLERLSANRS